jgi:hypothetical protein
MHTYGAVATGDRESGGFQTHETKVDAPKSSDWSLGRRAAVAFTIACTLALTVLLVVAGTTGESDSGLNGAIVATSTESVVDGAVYSDYQFSFSATTSGTSTFTSVCSSTSGATVFAADSVGKVYVSKNSGSTWTSSYPSNAATSWSTIVCSDDGQTALVSGSNYVYKTTNQGASWTLSLTALYTVSSLSMSSDGTYALATDTAGYINWWKETSWSRNSAKDYYTCTNNGGYCSPQSTSAVSSDGSLYLVADSSGYIHPAYKYTSGATILVFGSANTVKASYQGSAISSDNYHVVVGTTTDTVYIGSCSSEAKCTWTTVKPTSTSSSWTSFRFAKTNSVNEFIVGTSYSSTTGNVLVSTNYGSTWFKQTGLVTSSIRGATTNSDFTQLFVAVSGSNIYKGAPGAPTAKPTVRPTTAPPTTFKPTLSPTGYGELSWAATGVAAFYADISCSTDGSKVVAVTIDGKIYRSTDFGNNFAALSTTYASGYLSVAYSSDGTTVLVGGSSSSNVYASTDSGATFSSFSPSGVTGSWYVAVGYTNYIKYYFVANKNSGYIYYNAGGNSASYWQTVTSTGAKNWNGIACSSSGQYVVGESIEHRLV